MHVGVIPACMHFELPEIPHGMHADGHACIWITWWMPGFKPCVLGLYALQT